MDGKTIEYEFKHINIPENHGMDDSSVALLMKLDEALCTVPGKKEVDLIQKQINDLYVRNDPANFRLGAGGVQNPRQRELTNQWVKSFLQKKDTTSIEQELKSFETKAFTDFLNTDSDSAGGVLVPELLLAEIQHYTEENGYARRDFRYLPFSGPGNTRRIPVEKTGISVSWIDQAENKPISNLVLDQVEQTLKKLACISVITEELLEDSAVDLTSYISQRIGEAIVAEEDSQFFSGVGTPWEGILNNASCTPVTMGTGSTLKDIRPEDMLNMIFALAKGHRAGSKFYISSDTLLYLLKYRSDSVAEGDSKGQFLIGDPLQNVPMQLWGFPIVVSDVLPAEADADEADVPFAFFGNLQKTGVYGDKLGLRIKILTEASLEDSEGNCINLAQADLQAVRIFKRVGAVLTLAEGISVLSTGAVS